MNLKDPKPFRFKQFEVHHHLATFKVNTDGVLLGCSADVSDCHTALDIGTGSGMIALMLAQKNPNCTITGIEVDELSAEQASYNVKHSPFAEQIRILNADCYTYNYQEQYDLIVCNPPYFTQGTRPSTPALSKAKHTSQDFIPRLIRLVEDLLSENGQFMFIYPFSEDEKIITHLRKSNLHLNNATRIQSYQHSEPYCIIYTVSKKKQIPTMDTLVLYVRDRIYTAAHQALIQDFMLDR